MGELDGCCGPGLKLGEDLKKHFDKHINQYENHLNIFFCTVLHIINHAGKQE